MRPKLKLLSLKKQSLTASVPKIYGYLQYVKCQTEKSNQLEQPMTEHLFLTTIAT